jgi:hypothetical protein
MIVNNKIRIMWKEAALEYFMIISRVLLRFKKTHREHVTIASLWVKN